jgi:hypothetical protein
LAWGFSSGDGNPLRAIFRWRTPEASRRESFSARLVGSDALELDDALDRELREEFLDEPEDLLLDDERMIEGL